MQHILNKRTMKKVNQPPPGAAGKDFLEERTHSAGGLADFIVLEKKWVVTSLGEKAASLHPCLSGARGLAARINVTSHLLKSKKKGRKQTRPFLSIRGNN